MPRDALACLQCGFKSVLVLGLRSSHLQGLVLLCGFSPLFLSAGIAEIHRESCCGEPSVSQALGSTAAELGSQFISPPSPHCQYFSFLVPESVLPPGNSCLYQTRQWDMQLLLDSCLKTIAPLALLLCRQPSSMGHCQGLQDA